MVCNASDSTSHYWDQLQSFSGGGLSDTLSRHRLGTAAHSSRAGEYETTRNMRIRHQMHRWDIKNNTSGLGSHFFKHAEEMGINMNTNMYYVLLHLFINTL